MWVRDMGHQVRAPVKRGKDGDEDDQVDVWCVPGRKTVQHRTAEIPGVKGGEDAMRWCRLRWHVHVERKGDADWVNPFHSDS